MQLRLQLLKYVLTVLTKSERALANTGNQGVEAAMEWYEYDVGILATLHALYFTHTLTMERLIAHENDPGMDEPVTPSAASGRVLLEGTVKDLSSICASSKPDLGKSSVFFLSLQHVWSHRKVTNTHRVRRILNKLYH